MAKIMGLGGIFFKSPDPKALCDWYGKWLGFEIDAATGSSSLPIANLDRRDSAVWCPFPEHSKYFEPSRREFMINFIVDDVQGVLEKARAGGAEITGEVESYDYGTFGWFVDPDGNKIELWKPAYEA